MGLLESLSPGGQAYVCPLMKRIDRERIKIERSLDRQAGKRICIMVFSKGVKADMISFTSQSK